MAVANPPSGSGNDTPALATLLAAHDDVELPAGAVYEIATALAIPSSSRLWSDPANPATLKRMGDRNHIVHVNGVDVRIENLRFDWNMLGVWRQYNSCIAFGSLSGTGITPAPISDISIIGCRFIESGARVPHGNNDSWCISLTPAINQNIANVKILGCSSDADVQLIGNGTNDGEWNGIEVAYNYCKNGWAASVGITSLHTTVSGGETTFNNVNIHHNMFRNGRAYGIAVGVDNSADVNFSTVQVNDLVVSDNLIEISDAVEFPACVLIRAGLEAGYTASAVAERNLFSVRRSQKKVRDNNATNTPRLVSLSSNTPGSTLLFRDNVIDAAFAVTNFFSNPAHVAVTSSGNKYINGQVW